MHLGSSNYHLILSILIFDFALLAVLDSLECIAIFADGRMFGYDIENK